MNLPEQLPGLPEINIEKIRSLDDAKQQLSKLLNLIENLFNLNNQILKENQVLKDEVAKLKGYSSKPKFKSDKSNKGNHSVSKHLKKMKKRLGLLKQWSKSSKKGKIEIDKVESLPDVCECGNTDFKTLRTCFRH